MGFDLTGENGAAKIAQYPSIEAARAAVEKFMAAKI